MVMETVIFEQCPLHWLVMKNGTMKLEQPYVTTYDFGQENYDHY